MPTKKILYIGAIGSVVLFVVLFWFSFLSDNGAFAPRQIEQKQPPPAIPSDVSIVSLPARDYLKILEKYKGMDVERAIMDKKLITLTFDGGGNADGIEKILETLSENSIRSTFFLTGIFVEKFPDAVEGIKKTNNEIANHTYSHKNFIQLSQEETVQEINQMKTAAEKTGIALAPFSRFPYGAYKKEDIALVNSLGYVSVRWTIDSLGWQGRRDGREAKFVGDRVVEKSVPGTIVLMHLGSASDGSTFDADALPGIINTLEEKGYQFVTLSELFTKSLQ